MSPMRTLLSLAAVLAAVSGLAGCYDLSAPDGPQREDFMRNRSAVPPQPVAADPTCGREPCVVDTSTAIVAAGQPLELHPAQDGLDDATHPTGGARIPNDP